MVLEKFYHIFLAMSGSYSRIKSGEIAFTMIQNVSDRVEDRAPYSYYFSSTYL